MIHGYFCKLIACVLYLLHHFKADRARSAFKRDVIKDIAADQPKITINIAKFETERQLHHMVVQTADHLSY